MTGPGAPTGDLALVLTGGGARAAYQIGVLSGIAELAGDDVRFPIITGVSAGAINAAGLASSEASFGESVARLRRVWMDLSIGDVFDAGWLALAGSAVRWAGMLASGAAFKTSGVLDTRPLRRTLARHVRGDCIEANLESGRLRALALSATSYANRRTVTFVQSTGDVPMWARAGRGAVRARIEVDHVLASSALPVLFPAVQVGDEFFGDGSIRQLAPLAPAIHLGARRLLAIGLRHAGQVPHRPSVEPVAPPPAKVLGLLMNAVFLDALDSDAERLLRINRMLEGLPTPADAPEGLRPLELLVVRPSRDLGRLAADLAGHLPSSFRLLLRGLGSAQLESPDMLSYLLFERPYIERLIELGHRDTVAGWSRIEPLLSGVRVPGARD